MAGFNLENQSARDGDRFELLEWQEGSCLIPTGRYGTVINILQDGDADVKLDDGNPPHMVKWRQILKIKE